MNELNAMREALPASGAISRRDFVAFAAALSSVPLIGGASSAAVRQRHRSDPFTLGVASGDPDAFGFVLWTRLARRPLEPDGGMPAEGVSVQWEVAEDERWWAVAAGKWHTASIPLSMFSAAGFKDQDKKLAQGEIPFVLFFDSQQHDRGLVIDRISVSRSGPGVIEFKAVK